MIRDIYTRDSKSENYNENIIEVTDTLSQLILKIENVLFTNKGDVLGSSDMGCNLEQLIFSVVLNESVIEETINNQIQSFCLVGDTRFKVNSVVKFFSVSERKGALVDIYINDNRIIGVLF